MFLPYQRKNKKLLYHPFNGFGMDWDVPDFTTVRRFKEKLITHNLKNKWFNIIFNLFGIITLLFVKDSLLFI